MKKYIALIIVSLLVIGLGITLKVIDSEHYAEMNRQLQEKAEQSKVKKILGNGETNTEGIIYSVYNELSDEKVLPEFVTYEDGEVDNMSVRQKMRTIEAYQNVLTIPSLNIKAPIIDSIKDEDLWKGVCHYTTTAEIGEYGNCVLAGHGSQTYKYVFSNLKDIKEYADVHVWDSEGKEYIYTVIETAVIYPTDKQYLLNNDSSAKYLTLFTCTNHGTQRFVVRCKLFTAESELDVFNKALAESEVDVLKPLEKLGSSKVDELFKRMLIG